MHSKKKKKKKKRGAVPIPKLIPKPIPKDKEDFFRSLVQ
jgi:hypothetical protein